MRQVIGLSILIFLVAACRPQSNYDMRPGMGMEPGGMSDRHHAQVPEEYADKKAHKSMMICLSPAQRFLKPIARAATGMMVWEMVQLDQP